MNQSEAIDQLATALAKAQAALKPAHFDKVNPHFKNKFASLTSVQAAAKVFAEHGIGYTQLTGYLLGSLNTQCYGLFTTLMHSSGQWVSGFKPLRTELKPQEEGSELTYAKRYALAAAFGISADDDDDAQKGVTVKTDVDDPKITEVQAKKLLAAADEKGVSVAAMCSYYDLTSIGQLPASLFDGALKKLSVPKKGGTK